MRFESLPYIFLLVLTSLASWANGIHPPRTQNDVVKADALGDVLPKHALLRLGSKRFQHPKTPAMIALSADGSKVFSMDRNWLIGWELASGKQIWKRKLTFSSGFSLSATGYGVQPLAIIPNSGKLITSSSNGRLKFWNPETGRAKTIKSPASSSWKTVDVSPNSDLIAMGEPNQLWVCNIDGEMIYEVENNHDALLDLGRPGDHLKSGGDYCYPQFSPDGNSLALVKSKSPKTIFILNASDGTEIRTIIATDRIVRMEFSPDGSSIVTTERDCAARLYDFETGNNIWESVFLGSAENEANCTTEVDFRPDGKQIAVGAAIGSDHNVRLLDATTGKETGILSGIGPEPWHLRYTQDGKRLVSTGQDAYIRTWDVETTKEIPNQIGIRASAICAISKNEEQLAFVDDKTNIHLVNIAEGSVVKSFNEEDATTFGRITFSRDGSKIGVGYSSADHVHVSVWDIAQSKRIHHWHWNKDGASDAIVNALSFSDDGERISAAVHRQNRAKVFDLKKDQEIAEFEHKSIFGAEISGDGKTLFTTGLDRSIDIWNCDSAERVLTRTIVDERQRITGAYGLKLSHNQKTIATCNVSSCIRIFDMKLNEIALIDGAGGFTADTIEFSKNDLWITSGTQVGLSIFDIATGDRVFFVKEHDDRVYSIDFGSRDKTLLSGGTDGVCYLWNVVPDSGKRPKDKDLFQVLVGTDGLEAYQAFHLLSASPDTSFELLHEQLSKQATQEFSTGEAAKWVAAIGSSNRRLARNAKKKIRDLGPAAYPELISALKGEHASETKKRLVTEAAYSIHHRYRRATMLFAELDSPRVDQALDEMIKNCKSDHWALLLQEAKNHRKRYTELKIN